jgi:hypothetical protein
MFPKMTTGHFEFQIKRGVIDAGDVDDEVKGVIDECIRLCKSKKNKEAVEKIYSLLNFEWSWSSCDGDASDIVEDPDEINFDCNVKNCSVQLGVEGDELVITATAKFEAPVNEGLTVEQVQEWLDDNSAYACGYLSGGWGYSSTDGDNVSIVQIK